MPTEPRSRWVAPGGAGSGKGAAVRRLATTRTWRALPLGRILSTSDPPTLEAELSDVAGSDAVGRDVAGRGEPRRGLPARILGAALLRADVYEEVEADTGATVQAGIVVLLVSLIAGIPDYPLGWLAMGAVAVTSLLHWLLWAGIAYLIGDRLLGGTATWGELLRTLGFARAPGILLVLDPVVGGVGLIVHLWLLVAGVVAIRQALNFGIWRALLTAVLGIVPYWLVLALVLH